MLMAINCAHNLKQSQMYDYIFGVTVITAHLFRTPTNKKAPTLL